MTCTVVMKEGAAPQIGLGIKRESWRHFFEHLRVRAVSIIVARDVRPSRLPNFGHITRLTRSKDTPKTAIHSERPPSASATLARSTHPTRKVRAVNRERFCI
jgi:hypothetical protein